MAMHLLRLFIGIGTLVLITTTEAEPPSPKQQFVEVEPGLSLEVMDWGGSGLPIVFLPGGGCDAHTYDAFAPQFSDTHHVYAISARGNGASSHPATGYTVDRGGADLLGVMDALHLDRVVLVGHSIAGATLSWMSTHHPKRVAGLVYLDAAYAYAFYSPDAADNVKLGIDGNELRRRLSQLIPGSGCSRPREVARDILDSLPQLERDLRDFLESTKNLPEPTDGSPAAPVSAPGFELGSSLQKYTRLNGPILAIFADQGEVVHVDQNGTRNVHSTLSPAVALTRALPRAKVVALPHATHFVFTSNPREVAQEMREFLAQVK